MSGSRSRSGSKASTNIDRIRCYKCREYDHFAKDCPTSSSQSLEQEELEQLQQLLNLEDRQSPIQASSQNCLNKMDSQEDLRQDI